MKSLIANLLLSAFSLILTGALLEGGARTFWFSEHHGQDFCFTQDSELIHRNRSDCHYSLKETEGEQLVEFRFNDCGMRDSRPCSFYSETDTRIIALGDSFTYGAMVGEEESYVRVAETELKQKTKKNIAMINAGVSGWDLLQYQQYFKRLTYLSPKIVTVGILPNDFFSDLSEKAIAERLRSATTENPERQYNKIYQEARPWPERLVKWVLQKSRLVDLTTHFVMSNTQAYVSMYKLRAAEDSYLNKQFSPVWEEKMKNSERVLEQLFSETQAVGAKLVIVFIPQRIQAILLKNNDQFPDLDPRALPNRLSMLASKLGVRFVDFTEVITDNENSVDWYYPVDGHLTPAGQAALGRYLASALSSDL